MSTGRVQQHACGCRSLLSGVPRSPPVQPDPLLPALPPHGVFSSRELPSLLTAPLHAWSLTFCFSLLVSFLGWIVWWRPRVGASCRLPTRTCAWLLGSCPPAARGWGGGGSVLMSRLSAAPTFRKFHPHSRRINLLLLPQLLKSNFSRTKRSARPRLINSGRAPAATAGGAGDRRPTPGPRQPPPAAPSLLLPRDACH